MNKLDDFLSFIIAWVNRAIYVWGGQGETITSTAQIYRMETSNYNALRAIALWIKRGRNAVCFDCSGLLVAKLLSMGLIKYDTTANGLLSMSERINKSQLRRGDWVFRYSNGKAYHIGVIVDNELNVVESMGRDSGVVKRGLNATDGYWNVFARPSFFKVEIEAAPVIVPVSYQSHIQNIGWQDFVSDGETSGTTGKSLRIEAVKIVADNIKYRSHVQDYGWQMWHTSDQVTGTVGQSKRLEAIQIELTGDKALTHDVMYQVHIQDTGWQDWKKNGETAGTVGQSKRVEAIRIKIVEKV